MPVSVIAELTVPSRSDITPPRERPPPPLGSLHNPTPSPLWKSLRPPSTSRAADLVLPPRHARALRRLDVGGRTHPAAGARRFPPGLCPLHPPAHSRTRPRPRQHARGDSHARPRRLARMARAPCAPRGKRRGRARGTGDPARGRERGARGVRRARARRAPAGGRAAGVRQRARLLGHWLAPVLSAGACASGGGTWLTRAGAPCTRRVDRARRAAAAARVRARALRGTGRRVCHLGRRPLGGGVCRESGARVLGHAGVLLRPAARYSGGDCGGEHRRRSRGWGGRVGRKSVGGAVVCGDGGVVFRGFGKVRSVGYPRNIYALWEIAGPRLVD